MSLKEGGHWYDADGNPCHTQKCKAGSKNPTRATTIRDARKLRLYPSVTGILGILAKPQLERWKFRQITDYAVSNPAAPDGSEDPSLYFERAVEGAFKQVQDAADAGSRIHAILEDISLGKSYNRLEEISLPKYGNVKAHVIIEPVVEWFETHVERVISVEKRLVNKEVGFAGMADLLAELKDGTLACIDFKTRKTDPRYKCEPYEGQPMQIAAYAKTAFPEMEARNALAGCNLYISTTEPGRIEDCWYDDERLAKEFEAFRHVCEIWKHIKGYDPTEESQ